MQDRVPVQRDLPQRLMMQSVLGFGLVELTRQFLGARPQCPGVRSQCLIRAGLLPGFHPCLGELEMQIPGPPLRFLPCLRELAVQFLGLSPAFLPCPRDLEVQFPGLFPGLLPRPRELAVQRLRLLLGLETLAVQFFRLCLYPRVPVGHKAVAQPDFVVPLQHLIGQFVDSPAGAFMRDAVMPDLGGKRFDGAAQMPFLAGEIREVFRMRQRQGHRPRGRARARVDAGKDLGRAARVEQQVLSVPDGNLRIVPDQRPDAVQHGVVMTREQILPVFRGPFIEVTQPLLTGQRR